MSSEAKRLLVKFQHQLKLYSRMTTNQKKLLIKYTWSCQVNSFVLSLKRNALHLFRLAELLLHNLLFQQYVIEFSRLSIEYEIFMLANCKMANNAVSKIKLLGELRRFRSKKVFSLKRIHMVNSDKEDQWRSIYFISDLLTQQLFTSILKSRVESNSYGIKKNKVFARGIKINRNSLCYKLSVINDRLVYTSLGKCRYKIDFI
jgi:hypothetical protein